MDLHQQQQLLLAAALWPAPQRAAIAAQLLQQQQHAGADPSASGESSGRLDFLENSGFLKLFFLELNFFFLGGEGRERGFKLYISLQL